MTDYSDLIAGARYRVDTGFMPGGRQVYTPDDERLMRRLANALEEATRETEWEYGLMGDGDTEPYSDVSEDLDWLLDDYGQYIHAGTAVVRRRKHGTWERVEGEGDAGN